MLYFLLNSELGTMGLIGYYFSNIPFAVSLLLILVYVFIPYLLGSVNTAIIVSGVMYHDDIRKHGSGNAGFTNIMRTYGKKAAIITFVGDILKTVVSVIIGWCVFGYLTAYIAAFACFIGHIFPVFYKFRGGKGVLCLTATILMLDWRIFLFLLVVFVICVAITKYISFGSVLCAMLFPIVLNALNKIGLDIGTYSESFSGTFGFTQLIAICMAVIIVIKHKENLKRIFNGTESKFKFKKSKNVEVASEADENEKQ